MFRKILIANRGEIACRVIKTARLMGVATVAVYSQADTNAKHVRMADEAIGIGPAEASQSYLDGNRLLQAALEAGAQAIHPGYGFLSENADFADACAAARIVFIGPPAAAIRAMGLKSAAKAAMQKAGVPITPGYHGDNQEPSFLARQAAQIGFPVLIKASAGGGGKGMRRVDNPEDFAPALASCCREARNAFGNDEVLIEKYLLKPRHVEVQIFADTLGNCIHLFERDCSVQRRHQKVLEEAPAPGLTAAKRSAMGKAAVDAAKAVGYVGAGTVEFIVNADGSFYFMEMNTRLQVEHPVTEMVTGLDLVEWQLKVAIGEPLPLRQEQVAMSGHAIEARLYAEDPETGFLPSTGPLLHVSKPEETDHVRIDTGVDQGDAITPFYDPMIAKLVVWDASREAALARLRTALSQYHIAGIKTNIEFLSRLAASPSFAKADLDTGLIERETAALFATSGPVPADVSVLAALADLLTERQLASQYTGADRDSPWRALDGWQLNGGCHRAMTFQFGSEQAVVGIETSSDGWIMSGANPRQLVRGDMDAGGLIQAELGGRQLRARVVRDAGQRHVFLNARKYLLIRLDGLDRGTGGDTSAGGLRAPMPGRILALLVKAGSAVSKGTPLLAMEAMKMEHTLSAPSNGIVTGYRCEAGDQVAEGSELVAFEAAP